MTGKFKVHSLSEFMKRPVSEKDEEDAYRRGFDQGSFVAVQAFDKKIAKNKITKWREKVHAWRWNSKEGMTFPPDILK